MRGTLIEVDGFALDPGLLYDPDTHLWVQPQDSGLLRVGFDPLGRETSGDVVALSFVAVGTAVDRGASFGDVEAAKLVGPLTAPVSGTVEAHNDAVLQDPMLVNLDPLGAWLVDLRPAPQAAAELARLRTGEGLADWFSAEVKRFREQGMLAE
ncbi:MAG TPA: hypothetical protein VD931_22500 [Baekduia sp.]|nr:hypothetical protein [Baekduia sp.]